MTLQISWTKENDSYIAIHSFNYTAAQKAHNNKNEIIAEFL